MRYKINYVCYSHTGLYRKENQDNFICGTRYQSHIGENTCSYLKGELIPGVDAKIGVFDGMGGLQYGDHAAFIAARNAALLNIGGRPEKDLFEYCNLTNQNICSYIVQNGLSGMGTTAAILVFSKKNIVLCNIGDSRIYQFSKGILEQISEDHSVFTADGKKAALSQNLGLFPEEIVITPYFSKGKYENKDIYLICTDGLTDMVSYEQIQNILSEKDIYEAGEKLLEAALMNGGKDNITLIICEVLKNTIGLLRK